MAPFTLSLGSRSEFSEGIKSHTLNLKLNRALRPLSKRSIVNRQIRAPLIAIRACVRADPLQSRLSTSSQAASRVLASDDWSSLSGTHEATYPTAIAAHYILAFSWAKALWDVGRCIWRLPGAVWGLLTGSESTIKEVEEKVDEAAEYVKKTAATIAKVAKEVETVAETVSEDADKVETMVGKLENTRESVKEEVSEATGSIEDIKGLTKEVAEKVQELKDNKISDSTTTTSKFCSNANDILYDLSISWLLFTHPLIQSKCPSIFPKPTFANVVDI